LPGKAAPPLIRATLAAKRSKFVPKPVTNVLFYLSGATGLAHMNHAINKKSGGKKTKKTKKTKKQNKYTKKEKKKINGVMKVIYRKKNSSKLYVKSNGRMINLKKYKKK